MNCRDTLYNRVEKPCIIGEISTYSCFGEYISGKANGFTRDGGEGITIAWNTSGKVKSVTGGSSPLDFFYSASGQRQIKAYLTEGGKASDYYIHDATGNVMAIYTLSDNYSRFQLKEQHIYGSGRLGIYNRNIEVYPSEELLPLSFTRGVKRYELSNHLGNVNSVISDRKVQTSTAGSYLADIKSYVDYYPFGYQIPERTWSSSDYRFGFNGQEKDDEIYGEGSTLSFEARTYNAILGRWFSIEPLQRKYSGFSPYAFCLNNPVQLTDPDGKDPLRRAQRYARKNNIEGTFSTRSNGGVFLEWGSIRSDGTYAVEGKLFNRNFGDKVGDFFKRGWEKFKAFSESLEGSSDPANTGRITEQDLKVGTGVVSMLIGVATLGTSLGFEAFLTGGYSIVSGVNDVGANSNGETLLQQQFTTPGTKQTVGNVEDGLSIFFGGLGLRALMKNPAKQAENVIGTGNTIIPFILPTQPQNNDLKSPYKNPNHD